MAETGDWERAMQVETTNLQITGALSPSHIQSTLSASSGLVMSHELTSDQEADQPSVQL